jgi:hypothetical protein
MVCRDSGYSLLRVFVSLWFYFTLLPTPLDQPILLPIMHKHTHSLTLDCQSARGLRPRLSIARSLALALALALARSL